MELLGRRVVSSAASHRALWAFTLPMRVRGPSLLESLKLDQHACAARAANNRRQCWAGRTDWHLRHAYLKSISQPNFRNGETANRNSPNHLLRSSSYLILRWISLTLALFRTWESNGHAFGKAIQLRGYSSPRILQRARVWDLKVSK